MTWQKADEKLPDRDGEKPYSKKVLVFIRKFTHGFELVAYYDFHLGYWTTGNFYEGKLNNVTHWRELPEGPEEE